MTLNSITDLDAMETSTETITTRGIKCKVHVWHPSARRSPPSSPRSYSPRSTPPSSPRGVVPSPSHHKHSSSSPLGAVVVYHGFGAHARFPTVRYLAELLSANNFIVYGLDFPGHGLSPGLRGYVRSAQALVEDGVNTALYAKKKHPNLPLFLAGGSMGGAIALAVSREFNQASDSDHVVQGMVLLAPMISIEVSCLQRFVLQGLTKVMPRKGLFPASEDASEVQFRDPDRRAEAMNDTLSYSGSLRVASAQACLNLSRKTKKMIPELTCPFLCIVAADDVVVDNEGAMELMMKSNSKDKTLKEYDALHGMLCELQPLRGIIERDIVNWLEERTNYRSLWSSMRFEEEANSRLDLMKRSGSFEQLEELEVALFK